MKSLLAVPVLLCAIGVSRARVESLPAPSAEEQTWVVDPVHSSVVFRVKHVNTSWFYGCFTDVKGEIAYDPAKPEAGKVSLEIATESVETRDPKRNAHLKSPDFFDAKQNPKITFKSTKIAAGKDKSTFKVTGDLQMHGVTKSVEIEVEKTGEGDFHGPRVGFEATPVVKRSDYGMKYGLAENALGDEVTLKVSLECTAKSKG